jgi:hypothetical protein
VLFWIVLLSSERSVIKGTVAPPAVADGAENELVGTPVVGADVGGPKGEGLGVCRLGPNIPSIMGRIVCPKGVFKKSAGSDVILSGMFFPTKNWQTSFEKLLQLLSIPCWIEERMQRLVALKRQGFILIS